MKTKVQIVLAPVHCDVVPGYYLFAETSDKTISLSDDMLEPEVAKLSDADLRQIEREGMDQQWPPL